MAVAAGMVDESPGAAVVADVEVPAEPLGAAGEDVEQRVVLDVSEGEAPGVIAKDVGDGEPRAFGAAHLLGGLQRLQGAFDGLEPCAGEVGVDAGGGEALVSEEGLDGADVGALLDEPGGEGVTQGSGG
jgi:hypothetical protein